MPFLFNGVAPRTVNFNLPFEGEVNKIFMNGTVVYVKISLIFDENFGTSVSDKIVYYGETYGTLPTPTRSGYSFEGWYLSETSNNGTGTEVFSSSTVTTTDTSLVLYARWDLLAQQTQTPTINSATTGKPPFQTQGYTVRNNDGSTAVIKAEPSDSTPDVTINSALASGATTSFQTLSCQPGNCNVTVYATAQASGETLSNVTSRYFQ